MIDIKSMMAENIAKIIDLNIINILLLFTLGILLFWILNDLATSQKDYNKKIELPILLIIFMGIAIGYYLFIHQYYFILSLVISVILTYFVYWIGLLDMIIEKFERTRW